MALSLPVVAFAIHAVGLVALSAGQHRRRRGGRPLVGLWIATCATPLLGLGGTILGLTGAFDAVSQGPPDRRAAMLAEGISQAMSSTALGLAVFAIALASTIIATVRAIRARKERP